MRRSSQSPTTRSSATASGCAAASTLKPEIAGRVSRAWAAGRVSEEPPPGAAAQRGSVYVRDSDVTFVCLWDRPRGELLVVTLWEEGEAPQVPQRYTDALKDRRRSG